MIDCFDGLPVSWTIGTSPNANLVNSMLKNAISTLNPDARPIVHSDRGCHYRWLGWIRRMESEGLTRSMSKKSTAINRVKSRSTAPRFLGYTKDENKRLVIVPEEAEIVKRIYRE